MQGIAIPKIAPMPVPKIAAIEPAPESRIQLKPAPVQTFAPTQAPPVIASITPVTNAITPVTPAITPVAQPTAPVAQPTAPVQTFAPVHALDQAKPRFESMLDPSEALFDGMYELNYADSQWQAARLCASALGRALGARTVIIHAHDLASRELRAIGVHGDGEFDVLGSSDPSEDDLVASAVICNEKPVIMRFDGELPRLAPKRLGMIGAPRTLVAVPAMAWGRCVAVIEIIDADERLASRVADSAAYVAERLAEFLSDRAAA